MGTEETKIYTALKDFEAEGQSYKAGDRYELPLTVVEALEEGMVKESVETPASETPETPEEEVKEKVEGETPTTQDAVTPDETPTPESEGGEAPATEEKKEWAGNHKVGE